MPTNCLGGGLVGNAAFMGETITGLSLEGLNERYLLEDLGIDGWIISKWVLRVEDVDWIYLAHERYQWGGVVNAVMNIRVPEKAGNSLTVSNWAIISFWTGILMLH
jgi:hypothetical protein